MATGHATDAMIRRLERELEERNSAAQGLIANAEDAGRDLNDPEKETLGGLRNRMSEIKAQLEELESTSEMATQVADRAKQIDVALTNARKVGSSVVEYRSAGEYALDTYKAALGDRTAAEKLEVFARAADHQKTGDNLGVIPDPVIGDVINFIDASRPIVSALGPRPLPSSTWHRPRVTQHTNVDLQGTTGLAADEKAELVSQKMLITRLTANAVTYGGYVNVSRQNIDFSQPQVLDIVINDLASQYAIQTEAATAALLATTTTPAETYTAGDATSIASALWGAAATAFSATAGQGRLVLAVAPDVLRDFGPLFAPVNPQNAQSSGFAAGSFGTGAMGAISGITVVMSTGLAAGDAYVVSTPAVEVYEQRIGSLQVTEPSVLGVQVAYAGYFTPLAIELDGVVPIVAST